MLVTRSSHTVPATLRPTVLASYARTDHTRKRPQFLRSRPQYKDLAPRCKTIVQY